MKRFLLIAMFAIFSLSVSAEGISNYKELLAFAKEANAGADLTPWQNDYGIICLKADIDMAKAKKFPPIKGLNCEFDGCGHKLYNWKAKNALFHEIGTEGVVRNLVIDNSCLLDVKTDSNDEDIYIAFIANINLGQLINCENNGFIEHLGNETYKGVNIGGLVAQNRGVIYKCKNSGKISSNLTYTVQDKSMVIRIGGIAGACAKVAAGATIAQCENSGIISYIGDYPANNIGGIVGVTTGAAIKYCVNSGSVLGMSIPFNVKGVKKFSRVAGIVAWSDADIVGCHNLGTISATGSHESFAAGISCRPNGAVDVIDCVNFGKITTNASASSYTAGIAAQTISNVHITNCINYGEVACLGKNARYAAVGGIAGGFITKKDLKSGAYLRNCLNLGKVSSLSTNGGSGTAGIIGSAKGMSDEKKTVNITICDCENRGEVKGSNDHYAHLCGVQQHVVITGKYRHTWALGAKALADGSTIYGRIIDSEGNPIEGVVVSDGEQCVKSDVTGGYSMKSDLGKARFVHISTPAEYEVAQYGNLPQFFYRIPRFTEAVRADFTLKKREGQSDKFTLALIGDPQTNGLHKNKSTERLRDCVFTDINKLQEITNEEVYGIALGNLVLGDMSAFDDYVDATKTAKFTLFNAIGHHDYHQQNIFESGMGSAYYEAYIAPVNYSFNIGRMHFVVINSILYNRQTSKESYKRGMEEQTLRWLENDLKHISKEQTIVLCSHTPLFKTRANYGEKNTNYDQYSKLLAEYKKVYALSGFTHQNYSFDYAKADEKHKHLANIEVVSVARCIGQPLLNRELANDGTPNGYMVAEVDGDKMQWYYKTLGHDRNYQMRVYSPNQTYSAYVKATIWSHSPETWGNAEWWENGVKISDMTRVTNEQDIAYSKIYTEHNEQKLGKHARRYSQPAKAPFIFRVTPSAGVRSGEVRITDNFGNTYIEQVEW